VLARLGLLLVSVLTLGALRALAPAPGY